MQRRRLRRSYLLQQGRLQSADLVDAAAAAREQYGHRSQQRTSVTISHNELAALH
jgi:hypothetical protein